ncbi:hypothetical protein BDC45DRAFT_184175 [Circinella umbellata]|nr:hypothetical protein BDC45DRAFT_184175 [Circinella umbellata]
MSDQRPGFTPEIESYIKERLNADDVISFAQFLLDKQAFVVENSSTLTNYKTFWPHLFGRIVEKLDARTEKKRATWKLIDMEINEYSTTKHEIKKAESEYSTTKHGESGSSSLSSSASKRSSDIPLSTGVKDFVNDIYTTKLKHPKWQLPTEKIVEDTLHEFVKQCIYEHSSHSVILDVMDPCWRTYFTPDK